MRQKVETAKQWSIVNENKIKELMFLEMDNDINTKNFTMDNKDSWEQIQRLNDNTLSFLLAINNLWGEYKNVNSFISSAKQNEAWLNCIKESSNCDLKNTLNYLDSASITFASNTYKNTEMIQEKIKDKINNLKNLSYESFKANGLNSTLDAMSKINAEASDSLNDLNLQMNTLLKLFSQNVVANKNDKLIEDELTKEYKKGVILKDRHINLNILQ